MLPPCLDRGELTVGHRPAWSSCDGRHGGLDVVTVVAVHEVVARVGQRYLPGAAVAFTRKQQSRRQELTRTALKALMY